MPPETTAGITGPDSSSFARTPTIPHARRNGNGEMHILHHTRPIPRPAYLNGHTEVAPDLVDRAPKLSVDTVTPFYQVAAARVAVGVDGAIRERYRRRPISEGLRQKFEVDLDMGATPALEANIHQAPFVQVVERIERAKEFWKYGVHLPNIEGPYGFGQLLDIRDRHVLLKPEFAHLGIVRLIMDPIERTKEASRNSYALEPEHQGKGSTVQIGGAVNQEFGKIPTEEEGAFYADGITVDPITARLLSRKGIGSLLDLPKKDVMRLVLEAHKEKDPRVIEAVGLRRERNQDGMRGWEDLGVRVTAIPDGDLTHKLDVVTSNRPKMVVGSGGKEEAVVALFGAKTQDAPGRDMPSFGEVRFVGKQGELVPGVSKILALDQVAPGRPQDYFVVFASINGVPELGMGGVTRALIQRPGESAPRPTMGSDYRVQVGTVTSRDRYIRKDLIPITRNRLHR